MSKRRQPVTHCAQLFYTKSYGPRKTQLFFRFPPESECIVSIEYRFPEFCLHQQTLPKSCTQKTVVLGKRIFLFREQFLKKLSTFFANFLYKSDIFLPFSVTNKLKNSTFSNQQYKNRGHGETQLNKLQVLAIFFT